MKALEKLVMLDLTHMLAGPYGTQLLADMGLQTIKIDPPGGGSMIDPFGKIPQYSGKPKSGGHFPEELRKPRPPKYRFPEVFSRD